MKDYPKLLTERLILDQLIPADIPDIVSYAGNTKIVENTRTMPHPYYDEDAISWINIANQGFKNKDHYIFAIRFIDTQAFMGGIGLTLDKENNRAELGYWLAEKFWGLGYTTEAVQAMLKFGFEELQLNKIYAVYLNTNLASGKVMIKNGMIKEAELKDHDVRRGKTVKDDVYVTLLQYRLTKSEYALLT